MQKSIQVFLLKQKIMGLFVKLLNEPEAGIEHSTIMDFIDILNKFFIK